MTKQYCTVVPDDYIEVSMLRSDVCQINIQDSLEGCLTNVQLTADNVPLLMAELAEWYAQHNGR